jgi:hypothetical protein
MIRGDLEGFPESRVRWFEVSDRLIVYKHSEAQFSMWSELKNEVKWMFTLLLRMKSSNLLRVLFECVDFIMMFGDSMRELDLRHWSLVWLVIVQISSIRMGMQDIFLLNITCSQVLWLNLLIEAKDTSITILNKLAMLTWQCYLRKSNQFKLLFICIDHNT